MYKFIINYLTLALSYSLLYKSHLNYFFSPASYLYMSADHTARAVVQSREHNGGSEKKKTCMRKVNREDGK